MSLHCVLFIKTFILMGCFRVHRVANPEKIPVSDVVRKLYPIYEGIESMMKPVMVHLQVCDSKLRALYLAFNGITPLT